ncbi:histidine phosphatase family protein [Methylobacterium sp. Leaf466]|uniref:SixA phosphatase family protein n=1 Tax=Methylobacterium sp. Leaf466 TaxID=1736386 RepID=UPI0006FFB404|nr:histidine phosphatase family protein [Methylobacterium sp. Leaf466]KQT81842.1 phosphoglycerate mutase [Methylobacterium sp. Leaf466]
MPSPDAGALRLVLLRHAKSDHPAGVADLDRPLNDRGKRAAPLIGAHLAEAGLIPDRALLSPSQRTRETWKAVADALGRPPCEIADGIYEAPAGSLLRVIRSAPDEARTLLVIGHNPGLQDLGTQLAGAGEAALCQRLAAEFPTAAYAVIAFDADAWREIGTGTGRLVSFVRPRDLTEAADA